jgi:hypothetical protein
LEASDHDEFHKQLALALIGRTKENKNEIKTKAFIPPIFIAPTPYFKLRLISTTFRSLSYQGLELPLSNPK